jgi:hypothetical protein
VRSVLVVREIFNKDGMHDVMRRRSTKCFGTDLVMDDESVTEGMTPVAVLVH